MYWLTENSRLFLERGYLSEGVTPEERIREIADTAEKILGIEGFSDKFYGYMEKGFYSLSSPVWSNFGTNKGLPISCYGSSIEDSMESILFAQSEVGMMSKYGGGTSGYFGNIRERGADITNNGHSSGAVHFMKLFDTMTDVVSQGSTRRGAFAPYLPIEHPDIMEFLQIGTEGNEIQDSTYAVTVTNDWLIDMISGDKDKRAVWAEVLKRRTEIGYPYIMFYDNVNDNKPEVYKDLPITHSNLCVPYDTQILTSKGYIEIGDLVNQKVTVWNGEEWSDVLVQKTNTDQELIRVITNDGYELESTKYHHYYRMPLDNNGRVKYGSQPEKVEAQELRVGDKLIKFDLPVIEGEKKLRYAYDNGFYSADGTEVRGRARIYLYNDKKDLAPYFTSVKMWNKNNSNRYIAETELLQYKYFVPTSKYTIKSRIEWLAGFLDGDGTIVENEGNYSIQASSINKDFLKEIQLMLQTLGVHSKVSKNKDAGLRLLPKNDGTGELDEYYCQDMYRLLIASNGLYKLHQLGLKTHRLKYKTIKPQRDAQRFITVQAIESVEGLHDTYCFNEPKRHMGMFNGILTGQCAEIALPDNDEWSFVCNLSSMNALHFDEWKNTDAVETMVFFLDAVMEEFIQKLEQLKVDNPGAYAFMRKAHKFAKENRALGLGVLGLHSAFQSKMIAFESVEASLLNEQIFKTLRQQADKASEKLADMFGESKVTKGTGRRNATLLALAPTTSSAFILGQVSQSIEPLFSNRYVKDLAKTKVTIQNPYLEKLLEKYDKNDRATWLDIRDHNGSVQHLEFLTEHEKNVFKTFEEINQYEIINQASVRQQYIDQSQSLNLMIGANITTKELNELHLYAWEQGVKSLYYQHSTNAAQEFHRSQLCLSCEA